MNFYLFPFWVETHWGKKCEGLFIIHVYYESPFFIFPTISLIFSFFCYLEGTFGCWVRKGFSSRVRKGFIIVSDEIHGWRVTEKSVMKVRNWGNLLILWNFELNFWPLKILKFEFKILTVKICKFEFKILTVQNLKIWKNNENFYPLKSEKFEFEFLSVKLKFKKKMKILSVKNQKNQNLVSIYGFMIFSDFWKEEPKDKLPDQINFGNYMKKIIF